jgi:hypothetical protein
LKDSKSLFAAFCKLSDEECNETHKVLTFLKNNYTVSTRKTKKTKTTNLAKDDFIEKLKTKSINFNHVFEYKQTSTESLLKVNDLDLIKDFEKVKHD